MKTTLHRPGHGDFFKETSKPKLGAIDVDLSCTEAITVKCLAQLYKTVGYVPKAIKKNGLGITGYLVRPP
jgi:tripeptidyl-peptidase-1